MSRLIGVLVAAANGVASAQPASITAPAAAPPDTAAMTDTAAPPDTAAMTDTAAPPDTAAGARAAPEDIGEQGIGATVGVAAGGRATAGGLRVAGHYFYQLSDQDWFDGTATFTFGGGDEGCFRDRMNDIVCDHSIADGAAVELAATVRRFVAGRDPYWPFIRAGIGVGLTRFSEDELTGLTVPLLLGAGLRVSVSEGIAVIAEAVFAVGLGVFTRDLGLEPQLGGGVTAGAEFKL